MKLLIAILLILPVAITNAQTAAAVRVMGTVVENSEQSLTLRADDNTTLTVLFGGATSFRRVEPGARDLSAAETIPARQVAAGDRVLARGERTGDTIAATLIVVMGRSALEERDRKAAAEWQQRGVVQQRAR